VKEIIIEEKYGLLEQIEGEIKVDKLVFKIKVVE